MSSIFRALIVLAALGLSLPSMAQNTYRWVDADGNVHYSNTVPPEHKDYARDRLNDQAIPVERTERALTAEEQAERRRVEEEEARKRREAEAERQQIRQLLLTYADESDITMLRDQRVEVIDRSAEAARAYINGRTRSLSNLMDRAAQLESRGHEVSPALRSSIDEIRRQINDQEAFIREREAERREIRAYYDEQLERYRDAVAKRSAMQNAG